MDLPTWIQNSQYVLFAYINSIEQQLRSRIAPQKLNSNDTNSSLPLTRYRTQNRVNKDNNLPPLSSNSSALGALCQAFELSDFERQTLLLVAGTELVPSFRSLIGQLQGNEKLSYPTLDLALELFPEKRRLRLFAIADHGRLRDWELIGFKSS